MRNNILIFLKVFPVFFLIIFTATFGLLQGYFQQDEWMGIADVMLSYSRPWWDPYLPWVHFSPIGVFIWSTLYKTFHLQAQFYFLIQLIVHASCATLVYILTLKITKKWPIAFLTGFLFLINARAHQAFTHLAIFHTTTLAMFFILLFFVFLSSIKNKVLSFKSTLILTLIFIAAVATREEGFIIIPIAAIYLFCFDKDKINKKNIIPLALFSIGVTAFLGVRMFAQLLNPVPVPLKYQITGSGAKYNMVTVPVKFVVQNLIYSERFALFFIANTQKAYPEIDSFFTSQAPIMDSGFFYVFSMMAIIFAFWLWRVRPKRMGPIFIFLFTWIFANAFILSFVGRQLSVIEPRYLYFSSFPVLCLLSIFLYSMFISQDNFKIINVVKKLFVVFMLGLLVFTSVEEIRVAVRRQMVDGEAKKKIIKSLLTVHPTLSKNTIFYVRCKVECYRNTRDFGISNQNVLPFSSGPGMNFLVIYASVQGQEKEWGQFFTNMFLFDTFSEDYKKVGDRSFGYFVAKSKLEETLKKNKLSKDIVVALEIDESTYTFRDISEEFRITIFQN